jgi:hypothetical protein
MRKLHFVVFAAAIASATAAQSKTVVIFLEPMTLERHAQVFNTPGPDRYLMCMQPPSLSGCRELSVAKHG